MVWFKTKTTSANHDGEHPASSLPTPRPARPAVRVPAVRVLAVRVPAVRVPADGAETHCSSLEPPAHSAGNKVLANWGEICMWKEARAEGLSLSMVLKGHSFKTQIRGVATRCGFNERIGQPETKIGVFNENGFAAKASLPLS